jgi:hypothetical protein
VSAGTVTDSGPDAPPRRLSSRVPALAVLAGYTALAFVLSWSWWTPLGGRLTSVNEPDTILFSWLLGWTPHALSEGRWPLYTDLLNVPAGLNLMWNNSMALPGVLFAPVTAAFGGVATVTVITTLGLAGSAATAFWCLRSLGAGLVPAAVGGAVFGFSPAMMAQAVGGHPNLVFNVLVPVLVLLSVRLMTSAQRRPQTAVLLGVTAGAQVLIGEEILFLTGLVVGLILIILVFTRPRTARRRARGFTADALLALGTFVLVAGVPLGFQLFGPLQQEGSPFTAAYYSADLAGYVLPTSLQAIGPDPANDPTRVFAGKLEEHTAFLGWPVMVLAVLALVLCWRDLRARVALLAAAAVALLALGPELTIMGTKRGVPLPWTVLDQLPGFEHVLTTRLALFTAGLLGAGLAFALDDVLRHRSGPLRLIALGSVAVAFVPLVPAPWPGTETPEVPAFFTGAAAAAVACPGGSVLVLPFPRPTSTDAMLWQQASGYAFTMPGGYFIAPGDDGRAYVGGQLSATGQLFHDVYTDGRAREVTPEIRAAFAADVRRWRACAAVLGPAQHADALRAQATTLIGTEPEHVDGVLVWRDLPASSP